MKRDLPYYRAFSGLVLLMLGTAFYLFCDFGITWDEPNQNQYGKYVVQYYETFFADGTFLTLTDLKGLLSEVEFESIVFYLFKN